MPQEDIVVLQDALAEWLARRLAKPNGSPCAGSNPTGVGFFESLCEGSQILEHSQRDATWASFWKSEQGKADQDVGVCKERKRLRHSATGT